MCYVAVIASNTHSPAICAGLFYVLNLGFVMAIQPHQQRVIDEKAELDTKAHALSQFIGCSPIFETIDPAEQERLKVQNDLMWQYSEILGLRIAAFE